MCAKRVGKKLAAEIKEDDMIEAVEALLDVATTPHSNGDETFIECHACGGWDEHKADCFVPALNVWMTVPSMSTFRPTKDGKL